MKQMKASLAKNWRLMLMVVALVLVTSVYFLMPWHMWQKSVMNDVMETSAKTGLALATIDVSGAERTSPHLVREVMGIGYGDPMMKVDVTDIKLNVETLPWVKTARVSRQLPDRIDIKITERQPFAIWQLNGRHHLIDEEGVVIKDENLEEFYGLPFVVGKGAPRAVARLYNIISTAPDMMNRVKAAIRVGERRWDVDFSTGMRLRLPEEERDYGPNEAWEQFLNLDQEHRILDREIEVFDMRLKDRMIVKLTDEGTAVLEARKEEAKQPTKKTL